MWHAIKSGACSKSDGTCFKASCIRGGERCQPTRHVVVVVVVAVIPPLQALSGPLIVGNTGNPHVL